MEDYVIVSDATLDLPQEIVSQYDIKVIPMGFEMDNVEYSHYPDERELSIEDFYSRLKNGSTSHTTQITPAVFMEYFSDILKQGKDILYITFSSGLSGTYNTAQIVIQDLLEEYPDRRIIAIDSLCASIGEGLLVINAAIQKQKGASMDELSQWVKENKKSSRHWFTVKDLFYLKRGGRLSSLEAVVGTALKIRPVLTTDELGKLTVNTKLRGSKAEIDYLLTKMELEGTNLAEQTVIVGHSDNLEQAQELAKRIRGRKLVKEVIISKIGPVIGTHTGPGMLALVYMGRNSEQ